MVPLPCRGQRGVVFPAAVTGDGSWQEYVVVKASSFLPVPDSVSDAVAGKYPSLPFLTLLQPSSL